MSFKEFCKRNNLTREERRLAAFYLMASRMALMWDALMGDDDE
jgi:hypothetical protein